MSVLSRASVRYLARHPGQLALSILGIALGVAVAVGIELASGSARRAFELTAERLAGTATHRITGGPRGVPEQLYTALRLDPESPPCAPVVRGIVQAHGPLGVRARPLELFGVDPLAEARVRELPSTSAVDGFPTAALLGLGDVGLLGEATARELELTPGDTLHLRFESRLERVRLVATLPPGAGDDLERDALEGVLFVDVATAQELTGTQGRLSQIDLVLPLARAPREAALARLRAALPEGLDLVPASARTEELAGMTAAFTTNLRALALLSLFVGVFLVYNTITFSVVQRRGLWASLRTLGVTRREVFGLVLSEALVLGVVGTGLGLGLGTLLGGGLVGLVARTINDLYFAVQVSALDLSPGAYLRGALLGLGGTLLGAIPPAREATAQAPRTAQVRSTAETRARAFVPRLALLAALLALLSLAWLAGSASLAASFGALFALLLAAALGAPAATLVACGLAARVLGRARGSLGRMAARGVARNLSRNAVAIGALAIAIAASLGMGLMIASFRGTVARWLELSLGADVYVTAPHPVASRNESDLTDELVARLTAASFVDGSTTYRGFETRDEEGRVVFAGTFDLDPRSHAAFDLAQGEPAQVWERFAAGEAIVSEPLARRRGIGVGDELTLATDRGLRAFRVAGVFYDYTSDRGFVHVERDTYELLWDGGGVSSLALFLEAGFDPETAVEDLRALLHPGEVPHVRSSTRLKTLSLGLFDRTFHVTSVLRVLAGLVAFAGTLSALLALQLEREREVGVLRALGLTPRQVRGLVLGETGMMGAIAGLLALPLGVLLSWVLVHHVNGRAFGWTIHLELPPGPFLSSVALALGAALLAGLVPAWRMARISPARALRSE